MSSCSKGKETLKEASQETGIKNRHQKSKYCDSVISKIIIIVMITIIIIMVIIITTIIIIIIIIIIITWNYHYQYRTQIKLLHFLFWNFQTISWHFL